MNRGRPGSAAIASGAFVVGLSLAGLPEVPGQAFRQRPPALMPVQGGDQIVVRRSYIF